LGDSTFLTRHAALAWIDWFREPADLTPMPAIAHRICQGCGRHSEGLVSSSGSLADRCACGGVRQVVRIVRHAGGGTSPSVDELERSVQDRARDETLTPTRKEH